jgi:hypothetical protein
MLALAVAAAWITLAQGTTLQASPQRAYVATTANTPVPSVLARSLKQVVFARRSVLAAVVRVPTPCHRVRVVGYSRVGSTVTVAARITDPAPGTICAQVIATAYHAVSVPKLAAPARVRLRVER